MMTDTAGQNLMQTILVIDDDPRSLAVIASFLEAHGCRVVVSRDGKSGIERAGYVKPDLILLDIMMPGIDGFETCRQLKKDTKTAAIPVIFLTGRHDEKDIVTAFLVGGVDYITKPFKLEEVWSRVSNHLKIQQMQAQLQMQNEKLLELDRMKSMFIASMSHELRTPLNSIMGFTGVILERMSGEINDKQEDQLNRVYRASEHLLSMVIDILDISEIESGNTSVDAHNFFLHELIAKAIENIQTDLKTKGLMLTVNVPEDLAMHTDEKRLLQCIINLLSNALKFSESGTISVTASKEEEKENIVAIAVSDTGRGIAKEDITRLFRPFERIGSQLSGKGKGGGTGLGLYLTSKLLEDVLQGSIVVESQLAKGTTFSLRVPMKI